MRHAFASVAARVLLAVLALTIAACDPLAGLDGPPTGTPVASPSPTPGRTFVRPTPTPQPTFALYVVRTGDSLTSIARAFRTTPRSVALWNRDAYPSLDPDAPGYAPDAIRVGWRLRVQPGVVVDESDP